MIPNGPDPRIAYLRPENDCKLKSPRSQMTQRVLKLHVNPSDETIRLGPLAVHFLITGEEASGSIAAFELFVPGEQRLTAPAHSHDHYEETIYGIAGVLTWTVDGKQIGVGPEQALCIPRGAVHRFDNNGSQDAKALCVITPAAIGPQYFREVAEVINAAAAGPPDRTKMTEIMRRHGLTPAPPQS
jgi:quercetin dioxygenase-like cupin family protein